MASSHLLNINSLILIVGAILVGLYFYRRLGLEVKIFAAPKTMEELQKEYLNKRPKSLILSAKEKLEMSWKFLYEITETIINKFSSEDKQTTAELGVRLFESGMRYEHVVDYGINHEAQKAHEKIIKSSKELEEQQGQAR